jgi:hypothetical protein
MQRQRAAIRPWCLWSRDGVNDSTHRGCIGTAPLGEGQPCFGCGNIAVESGVDQSIDRICEVFRGDRDRFIRLGRDVQWAGKVVAPGSLDVIPRVKVGDPLWASACAKVSVIGMSNNANPIANNPSHTSNCRISTVGPRNSRNRSMRSYERIRRAIVMNTQVVDASTTRDTNDHARLGTTRVLTTLTTVPVMIISPIVTASQSYGDIQPAVLRHPGTAVHLRRMRYLTGSGIRRESDSHPPS